MLLGYVFILPFIILSTQSGSAQLGESTHKGRSIVRKYILIIFAKEKSCLSAYKKMQRMKEIRIIK